VPGDASLFVVEVGEQVALEHLEGIGNGSASVEAVVVCECSGGGLDGIEVVGHRAVVCS